MLILGQAINSIKASAAGLTRVSNAKSEPHKELSKVKPEQSTELHIVKPECSMEAPKRQSSAVLPADFFDNSEAKRLKTGENLDVEEVHSI